MPSPAAQPSISAIVTVLNEAKNITNLLDSLKVQEGPFDAIVVDAGSTDGTVRMLREVAEGWDDLHVIERRGQRGACRNHAVSQSDAQVVAFIDGDCIANPFWARKVREAFERERIVAGRTINMGYWAFEILERVALDHRGVDVTYPSCNLAYDRQVFLDTGGFDDWFVTAEDIDLNFRAAEAGHRITYQPDAIVYHRARDSFRSFFRQAFWNGYGRKQLTLKHGRLWKHYSFRKMLDTQFHFWGLSRLLMAAAGYTFAYIATEPPDAGEGDAPGR